MPSRIAVLGTGLMGAPMARRLIGAGHDVHVWNRSRDKADALEPDGATAHAEAADAVEGSDYVVTMLSDGAAVGRVLFDLGVGEAMPKAAIVIDMSSIRPSQAREHAGALARRGVGHLDAPVSGGTKGAKDGTLAIMVGGDATLFDAAAPILAAMGRPVRVGGPGTGQLAKLANQAIVGVTIGVVAEATLLMRESEADLAAFRDALSGGFADSVILQQHGKRMAERDFAPGGPSRLQLKDLDNVLEEARSLGLELPLVRAVRDRFETLARKMEGGELDHSALLVELETENGFHK